MPRISAISALPEHCNGLCHCAAIAHKVEVRSTQRSRVSLNPRIHHVTHRPKNLTRSQSPATKARFRSEKSVLRYALRQNKYVATPPLAHWNNIHKYWVSRRKTTHLSAEYGQISDSLVRTNIAESTVSVCETKGDCNSRQRALMTVFEWVQS